MEKLDWDLYQSISNFDWTQRVYVNYHVNNYVNYSMFNFNEFDVQKELHEQKNWYIPVRLNTI